MPISLDYFEKAENKAIPKAKRMTNLFAKWPADGLYYEVKMLSLDQTKNSCRVRYEDNLEVEALAKDLHCQLNDDYDEIICCVCSNGEDEPNIILCDTCNQGYHLNCHEPKPEITEEQLDDEDHVWICATCIYMDDCRAPSKKRSRQSTAPRICVTPAKPMRTTEVVAKCQSEPKKRAPAAPKNTKKTPKVKLNKPLIAPAAPTIPTDETSSQKRKSKMNRKQNTAEFSVPDELVETQVVEFTQPDRDVKAEMVKKASSDDVIFTETSLVPVDSQLMVRNSKGKIDTLKPELVVVAETLTMKPSCVGKKSLNALVDSAKMVDIVNDETTDNRVNIVTPQPLAITNGETRLESPTVIKAQKKQRKTHKTVAPAS